MGSQRLQGTAAIFKRKTRPFDGGATRLLCLFRYREVHDSKTEANVAIVVARQPQW